MASSERGSPPADGVPGTGAFAPESEGPHRGAGARPRDYQPPPPPSPPPSEAPAPPCDESKGPARPLRFHGRSSALLAPVEPPRSIILAANTRRAMNSKIQTHIHMAGLLSAPTTPAGNGPSLCLEAGPRPPSRPARPLRSRVRP